MGCSLNDSEILHFVVRDTTLLGRVFSLFPKSQSYRDWKKNMGEGVLDIGREIRDSVELSRSGFLNEKWVEDFRKQETDKT